MKIESHLEAKWHALLRAHAIRESIEADRLARRRSLYTERDARTWDELAAWHDSIDRGRSNRVHGELQATRTR